MERGRAIAQRTLFPFTRKRSVQLLDKKLMKHLRVGFLRGKNTPKQRPRQQTNLINRVSNYLATSIFSDGRTQLLKLLLRLSTTKHIFPIITCCALSHNTTGSKQTHLQQDLENRTKPSAVTIFHNNSHSANNSYAGFHICILCSSFTTS
jgi:hypothetical protein